MGLNCFAALSLLFKDLLLLKTQVFICNYNSYDNITHSALLIINIAEMRQESNL